MCCRQVANAEILSISLLMEDVLMSGFVEKSVFLSTDDSAPPPKIGRQRQGSTGRRMSIASPRRTSVSSSRKGSDAGRRMSDVGC